MPTINEVVDAYVNCGNAIGFFNAEMILLKYLPKNKPEGKCFDVPYGRRAAFIRELRKAETDISNKNSAVQA